MEAVTRSERLCLRRLTAADAAFILELVNEPAWLEHIGDRQVHSLDDARAYLEQGPLAMYAQCGFGLYLVAREPDQEPVGICGLLRREGLADADLGFAMLARHQRQGYAREAARLTLDYGRRELGFTRILAITSPANQASMRLLEGLGFVGEGQVTLPGHSSPVCRWVLGT